MLKETIWLVRDYVYETRKQKATLAAQIRPYITWFIKFDVAIATFKNLLKMAVLKERLNKTDMGKVG